MKSYKPKYLWMLAKCKFYEVVCYILSERFFVKEGDILARNDDMIIRSTSTGIVTLRKGVLVNYYGHDSYSEYFDSISDSLAFCFKVVGNINDNPELLDELNENTAQSEIDDKFIWE